MVSRMVDCGFSPQSNKPNDYKIGIYFYPAKHTARVRAIIG